MAALVFLAGVVGIYLTLVTLVETEKAIKKGEESNWDNDSWETQRG